MVCGTLTGVLLAWLRLASGSVWPPVIARGPPAGAPAAQKLPGEHW